MGTAHDSESLARPAKEVWNFDWKIGSVLQGDCYKAERTTDRDDVVIWLSRELVNGEQFAQLEAHVERLSSVRDWGEVECGIDSERRAFVALAHGSTKRIDFDQPGSIALRNRFITCLLLISQIHERGIGCGNITSGSFVIDSLGSVRFIGFLGGYGEKLTSTVPLDIRVFSRAGDGLVGAPSVAADVYALAVLGLELFGAQFPPAPIAVGQIDTYVEKVRADAPPWVLSVLATIVREPNRLLCRDMQELIRSISASDAEYLNTLTLSSNAEEGESDEEKPLSIGHIRETLLTPEELRKRRLVALAGSKYVKWSGIAFLATIVVLLFLSQLTAIRSIMPARTSLYRAGDRKDNAISDVTNALALLQKAESPRAEVSFSGKLAANATAVSETPSPAAKHQEGNLEEDIPQKLRIDSDSIVLAGLQNGVVTPEERQSILALYDQVDDESKARLARAFLQAEADTQRIFREFLEKRAQRGMLAGRPMPQPFSTDALFFAAETRLAPEGAKVWGREAMLSNDEVRWLLQAHAKKRSPMVPFFAKLVLDRQLIAWPRSIFVEAMAQSDERSGAPYEALLRASEATSSPNDVDLFLNWKDPLSMRVLYAELLLLADPEILQSVMSSLMSKPNVAEAARPILESCLVDGGTSAAKFAKLVGALGLSDTNSSDILKAELQSVRGDSKQEIVLQALLEKGSIQVVEIALAVYGESMHPETLLPLLSRPEPRMRKAAIPFLKGVRIASSKALIQERYAAEQDPEVRKVYQTELFPSS